MKIKKTAKTTDTLEREREREQESKENRLYL